MRFDRHGRHLFVSNNVTGVTNLRPEDFVGKMHRDLGFPEELCRLWEEAIEATWQSAAPQEREFVFDAKSGRTIFNWRLVPELDAQGNVVSILSISRDITAQRRAETDYQTLFREMLDGMARHEIICNDHGVPVDYRFLALNPAFERLTGLQASSLVGRTVREALPGIEEHWIEIYGRVAITGEPTFFESYSANLDKHFRVTAFRPAPWQFVCIFTDVTALKQAEIHRARLESQLQQAQKLESVGRLAGGVAHDFNNMLGVILGSVELAAAQVDPAAAIGADLEEIRIAAERSADLTGQLLAFARQQPVVPRLLDLNETIANMLKILRRLIGEDIDLEWKPAADLWPVEIDPVQMDQILANLCVNARDAIEGTGRVCIATANREIDSVYCSEHLGLGVTPGDFVQISVSDDGCGMSEEMLTHIFEPFFTTKTVGEGTGLGLATVWGVVGQNGGFVDVASKLGHGTSFLIHLPRAKSAGNSDIAAMTSASLPPGNETILLVEDEAAMLTAVRRMLTAQGYSVLAARGAAEAQRIAADNAGAIHLLLTDLIMPEMNGRELSEKLVSVSPGMKVLFMSGYTPDVTVRYGVTGVGAGFIQKPFSGKQLARHVRALLGAEASGKV
jgi:PAS domain S-box-containing protein